MDLLVDPGARSRQVPFGTVPKREVSPVCQPEQLPRLSWHRYSADSVNGVVLHCTDDNGPESEFIRPESEILNRHAQVEH